MYHRYLVISVLFFLMIWRSGWGSVQLPENLDILIERWMEEGRIPGLALVIVYPDGVQNIHTYGVLEEGQNHPVGAESLFEIASCSKSFTALAILKLVNDGAIKLTDPVSEYLPGFYGIWKGKRTEITISQLLEHRSGIPWESVDLIEPGKDRYSIIKLGEVLTSITLRNLPGQQMEYATVNYALLGGVIEKVSGMAYEKYMQDSIFSILGLQQSLIGEAQPGHAQGHKVGFGMPRPFCPPPFRSNYPAGYVLSNAMDLGRYLQLQLGLLGPQTLIQTSHRHEFSTQHESISIYENGWEIFPNSGRYHHEGQNPGFSSWIGFSLQDHAGVVVLANSNSTYTYEIGKYLLGLLCGDPSVPPGEAHFPLDQVFTILVIAEILLLILLCLVWAWRVTRKKWQKPIYMGWSAWSNLRVIFSSLMCVLLLLGLYGFPYLFARVSWDTALLWSPSSFQVFAWLSFGVILFLFVGVNYLFFLPRMRVPNQ